MKQYPNNQNSILKVNHANYSSAKARSSWPITSSRTGLPPMRSLWGLACVAPKGCIVYLSRKAQSDEIEGYSFSARVRYLIKYLVMLRLIQTQKRIKREARKTFLVHPDTSLLSAGTRWGTLQQCSHPVLHQRSLRLESLLGWDCQIGCVLGKSLKFARAFSTQDLGF